MFSYLQKIGKALMVPVAVLPAAAILLGLGYFIDPVAWGGNSAVAAFFIKSGAAIIDQMPILFAVGVAFGMSKDKNGAAALTGLVGFLVLTNLLSPGAVGQIMKIDNVPVGFSKINNQFIGILVGVISSALYNRFSDVELPKAMSFFSGKRLVPIITSFVMIIVAFILMYIWPGIYNGLVTFGESISGLGAVGAGIYGFLNRLLIPVGLHHALNSVFWFDVAGINDIPKFLGGAQSIANGTGIPGVTGMYQAGFFPIMMFGLLGAAAAFVKTAKPENKDKIKSIMIAAGFATFLTGVTEPLEFAFMFVAPGLYLVHAILTGISVFIAASMHWIAGFGFSAGLIDMLLSSRNPLATQWYMLIVQGLVFFFLYYFIFVFVINKFNLKTPGRETEDTDSTDSTPKAKITSNDELAAALIPLLGGVDNIVSVDNCITRLRLDVKDSSLVNDAAIKKITSGVLKPGKTSVQVIIGTQVEFVANTLKKLTNK
ncbi:PTS transporter subunit EIIBC [Cetobacterium sp. 8H]|uniref:N-acetylglucosamine-specific PTS transporter subunit IIBC n=1 Tax=Cetobacterium sp. 8H TaxID=2759681 RepID=UPI00163D2B14|nr:N-acetylglucosamine-specific PTS transporter subunit IIBC [Cetobacterium sp. 8H]MBC2850059.1 PTS transporter subunit EIIBC [Cetobacterium sp. 8H]